jgi:hypothetical protein
MVYIIKEKNMISDIIQEVRKNQALAKQELINDPRTLNTQLGNIKRAEENISQLFTNLRSEVQRNLVLILVTGKHAKEFTEMAEQNIACFGFEAEGIYKLISNEIHDSFLGKPASSAIIDVAMGTMSDLSHEVGIVGYDFPRFHSDDAIQLTDREALEKLIQKIFVREVGAELVTIKAIHDATKKILDSDFAGRKVPVLLHSQDKELLQAIADGSRGLTKNILSVNVTKKPTIESVEEKLLELSKKAMQGE